MRSTQRNFLILGVLAISLLATSAHAEMSPEPWDLSLKTGGIVGQMTQPSSSGSSTLKSNIGGCTFGVAINKDFLFKLSGLLQGQFVIDLINVQVIRQGLEAGLSFHLLGGAKRLSVRGELGSVTSRTPHNLSIAARAGFHQYAASRKDNPSDSLTGSAFELRTGLEYRRDITTNSSYGSEFLFTPYTLPTSVERLAPRLMELSVFWRFLM